MELAEYDTMAQLEECDWWYRTLRRMVCKALEPLDHHAPSSRILDAGCGTGGGLRALAHAMPSRAWIGLDGSPAALRHAARRQTAPLVQGSVMRLPFKENTFDAVLSLDVLCSDGVEESAALREVHRVLRPGGWLILNLPAFESLRGAHDEAVHIRKRYRSRELRHLLSTHGFQIIRLIHWNALLFPVVFLIRRLLRPRGVPGDTPSRSDLRPLPASVNGGLERLLALDTLLCRILRIPFGTSLFSTACKVAT